MTLAGPAQGDPIVHRAAGLRPLLGPRPGAAATARAKKLDRAREDLDRLSRGLGGRHYPHPGKVAARIATIARHRRVGAYLRADHRHRPSHRQADPDVALRPGGHRRRGRHRRLVRAADQPRPPAGRRRRGPAPLQGPGGHRTPLRRLQRPPRRRAHVPAQTNRRIAALISVICLALLVFCLIERASPPRHRPRYELPGLYVGRPARPTGRLIFEALAWLGSSPPAGTTHQPFPSHRRCRPDCWSCSTVDPTRPRWAS